MSAQQVPTRSPFEDAPPGGRLGRRDFLRFALLGGLLALTVELGAALVARLFPRLIAQFGSRLEIGRLANFPMGGAPTRVVAGKLFLVHQPDGLLALYWRCRHLGCDVPWHGQESVELPNGERITGVFHCPCHDSIYTREGAVVSGPADGPLDIFTVEVAPDGRLIVDTGEIWRRPVARAAELTPAHPGSVGPPNRSALQRVGAAP